MSIDRDKIINELRQEYPIEEQVKFNEFNIADKLQENMQLKTYYQQLYDHEQYKYEQLQEKMDVLKGNRYDFYRFDHERNLQKSEIENYYLPKDKKILQMKRMMDEQLIRVKFFKLCVNAVNDLYWRIKGYIDNEKL